MAVNLDPCPAGPDRPGQFDVFQLHKHLAAFAA
jgi:hypothetical protein